MQNIDILFHSIKNGNEHTHRLNDRCVIKVSKPKIITISIRLKSNFYCKSSVELCVHIPTYIYT